VLTREIQIDIPGAADYAAGTASCPQGTQATGGGARVFDPVFVHDGHENEARLIENGPGNGESWFAALRNESGRPFNGHDLKANIYVFCV